jgi:hypothetical protein
VIQRTQRTTVPVARQEVLLTLKVNTAGQATVSRLKTSRASASNGSLGLQVGTAVIPGKRPARNAQNTPTNKCSPNLRTGGLSDLI